MASVSAENSLGAERKPKGRALSLYASLRSSFASREPLPSDLASSTA